MEEGGGRLAVTGRTRWSGCGVGLIRGGLGGERYWVLYWVLGIARRYWGLYSVRRWYWGLYCTEVLDLVRRYVQYGQRGRYLREAETPNQWGWSTDMVRKVGEGVLYCTKYGTVAGERETRHGAAQNAKCMQDGTNPKHGFPSRSREWKQQEGNCCDGMVRYEVL